MRRSITVPVDDVRGKYREALKDEHFRFPRKTGVCHGIQWYLDGHLVNKPLVALHAYANLAEYMLHYVRFGRRGQRGAETLVVEFFAETRRAMQNVLSTYPIDRRLRRHERESVKKVAQRLCEHAGLAWKELGMASCHCDCPACGGTGNLYSSDVDLLEAILFEQSRNGTIPPSSKLFRPDAVDNPPRTVV